MADLDFELTNRLSRLAAAVPVAPGQLDPVHRGAVAARHRVRMAWLTPLLFVAVVAGLTTMLGIGPFAPGATPDPGPVSATARSGDFELTIRSPRSRYLVGEPIDIEGSLAYRGPEALVDISHGHGSPLGFSVVEPVDGMTLGLGWRRSCERSTLPRDAPIVSSFRKSGGFDGADPLAGQYRAWFADPELHLPVGTWHLYVPGPRSRSS